MAGPTKVKEKTLVCIDCESKIALSGALKLGQEVVCPLCDAVMEIVGLEPLQADWFYEEPEHDPDDSEADW